MLENRNPRYDLFAVILLVVVVFLAASLLSYDPADPVPTAFPPIDSFYQPDVLAWPQNESPRNAFGYLGAVVADVLLTTLGCGAYFLAIGLGAIAFSLLQRQTIQALWPKTIGWLLTLAGMTTLATMSFPNSTAGPVIGPGGYLGALCYGLLNTYFAHIGTFILASAALAVGLFMWTEYVIVRIARYAAESILAVFALLIPIGLLTRSGKADRSQASKAKRSRFVKDDLAATESDNNFLDELEAEVDEHEDEEEFEEDYDEEEEDYEDAYAEDDAEDFDEDEYEEDDEELENLDEEEATSSPATIPFVIKKAAKTARLGKKKRKEKPPAVEPETRPANPAEQQRSEREDVINRLNQAALVDDAADYVLPKMDLLQPSQKVCGKQLKVQTVRRGKILEKTFTEFGHQVKVVDVEIGPVITQYELQLEAGLRLAKITNLADDIAIALRVPSVRIVAPIPGKNTVGIEVPNETRQMVRLREVMEQSEDKTRKMKIPLFLGKDVAGDTLVADLASLPHLLIAGRTGTGKSVCLNAIISSILMTRRPDEVRMLMIDPKMVELSGYGRLPHLMHPVVTDMRKAEAILAWAVDKMEERYKLLAKAGVRHITSYNQLGAEELYDRLQPENDMERDAIPINLPFIVIVADEMADLMMTSGKEVEQHIIRLAQKSRAVGIHLILATQKPTVDVITGLIKSNLPARISYQVASRTDSRVVLDEMGAEKLLGNGDMLFLWPGTSTLLRGQGTYLSDEEIDMVTDSVSTGEQNFVNELINMKVEDPKNDAPAGFSNRDDLYHDAVDVVIRENRGSVSLLQRALGIGYGRAARLIDFMEEDGIVGPYNGSKSREIIMTADQWARVKAGESTSSSSSVSEEPAAESIRLPKSKPAPPVALKKKKFKPAVVGTESEDDDDELEEEPEFEEVENGADYETDYLTEEDDEEDQWEDESDDEEEYEAEAENEEEWEEEDDDWEDEEETDGAITSTSDASDNWISEDDDEVAEAEEEYEEDEEDDDDEYESEEEDEDEWEYETEAEGEDWEYEEDDDEEEESEDDVEDDEDLWEEEEDEEFE